LKELENKNLENQKREPFPAPQTLRQMPPFCSGAR